MGNSMTRQKDKQNDVVQKVNLAKLNVQHLNTSIQTAITIQHQSFSILTIHFDSKTHLKRTRHVLAVRVSYLEKFVSGYWKVYTPTIFADACINPNLLLDLFCSCVLEPCGHGCSNGDGDDVPSDGVILSGGRGGWSHCVRALLCSLIILGRHAIFVY